MAKQQSKRPAAARSVKPAPVAQSKTGNFLEGMEKWFESRSQILFYFIAMLCVFFSGLLFNARITESNDDALYIEAGYRYAKGFFKYYYTANAPLYPMFLSIPLKLFGLKLVLLKLLSEVFNFFQLFFLYRALKGRIPYFILFPVLLLTAVNTMFLYFASQTFTESFFLFFQSLFLFCFFNLFDVVKKGGVPVRETYLKWIWLGLLMFILAMTKNVAIVVVPVIMLFFALRKEWINMLCSIVPFAFFKIIFDLFKKNAWGTMADQYSQTSILFMKDPYDFSQGKEDTAGFIRRLYENADLYFSKRFFQIMGFMDEGSTSTYGLLTVMVIALMLFGIYRAFKRNNYILLFTGIYVFAMNATSFLALQTRWYQPRIVMIYVPLMLMLMLYGFYDAVKRSSSPVQLTYLYVIIIICFVSFSKTLTTTGKNFRVLTKNLKGDIYYGYAPDWTNYLKMSEWCAEHLPDTAVIACRKAPMSFVYGNGRTFFPIYRVVSTNADTILMNFKKNKVDYVIMASLRRNPSVNNGEIINTIQRMLAPIAEKYPNRLAEVKQIGETEPAYLYKIMY